MIETGQTLPDGTLHEMTAEGPRQVAASELFAGRRVALFGVPGAFTPTCHNRHVPSFVANMEALRDKGVAEVICLSVNDPFVMGKWGEATGASAAGIRMVGDATGSYTKALGLDFSAEAVGLLGRAKRFAAIVDDGTVTVLAVEPNPGQAVETTAEALLAKL